MDKKKLQQIANILYINTQRVDKLGLLHGKLGIAIFFYHYARYTADDTYYDFPNEYVRYLQDKLENDTPEKFADGLSGIGWGFDHIVREGFIEADADLLTDVDQIISKMDLADFIKETELSLPLFSKGLYFIQRNNDDILSATVFQIENFLHKYSFQKMPIMYINSIAYVLAECIRRNIKLELCRNLLKKLLFVIIQNMNDGNYTREDYILLQQNINMMHDEDCLVWKDSINTPEKDLYNMKREYESNWIDFLFFNKMQSPLGQIEECLRYSDILSSLKYSNLSIYRGLAGMGLCYMNKKGISSDISTKRYSANSNSTV